MYGYKFGKYALLNEYNLCLWDNDHKSVLVLGRKQNTQRFIQQIGGRSPLKIVKSMKLRGRIFCQPTEHHQTGIRGSMVEFSPSKRKTWVRFPANAFLPWERLAM
ncbi:hypothetical protein ROZALSC1DRAFT_24490 [Rozella allomycis CSF55]|uniref:Uncharacterized protein n=1 Tax=Rozella allomycis (strain CSF55) TaxID=988480 RepID=A0A4P9YCP1_ROZAC|nr:hypothetical protein ROZALSC1DRAFT_24490 [Rozella allomycis CSF55]